MIRRPPRSTRTDTLFPYTTLFRSGHVMGYGLSLITLDLSDTKSLAEAQAKIRAYAAANTGRKWIIGTGWNQELWGLGRFPTAAELDPAVSDVTVRTDERRVGTECGSTGCTRVQPDREKINEKQNSQTLK